MSEDLWGPFSPEAGPSRARSSHHASGAVQRVTDAIDFDGVQGPSSVNGDEEARDPVESHNEVRTAQLHGVNEALLWHPHTANGRLVPCFIHNLGCPWFELSGAPPVDTTMGLVEADLGSWCVGEREPTLV